MRDTVRVGQLEVDRLTWTGALARIAELVRAGQGGAVFTPNVDHVVQAEQDAQFRSAYLAADLCLADGMPLLWAARFLGRPLPACIRGSDLIEPLAQLAVAGGWGVYLLGAAPGVAARAAQRLRERYRVEIRGVDAPLLRDPLDPREAAPVLRRVQRADPELLLVALGAPKQELFIHAWRRELGRAVALGVGAGLDFLAGTVSRAPRWMSEAGLEWLYRLAREPGRLWRRYLVRDPRFAWLFARELIESLRGTTNIGVRPSRRTGLAGRRGYPLKH